MIQFQSVMKLLYTILNFINILNKTVMCIDTDLVKNSNKNSKNLMKFNTYIKYRICKKFQFVSSKKIY